MSPPKELKQNYPWVKYPLVVGAPMRLISLAELAVEVSKAREFSHRNRSLHLYNTSLEYLTCRAPGPDPQMT